MQIVNTLKNTACDPIQTMNFVHNLNNNEHNLRKPGHPINEKYRFLNFFYFYFLKRLRGRGLTAEEIVKDFSTYSIFIFGPIFVIV